MAKGESNLTIPEDIFQEISTLREIKNRQPPTYLYHYTSSAGLIGIVESKSIWMSDTTSLNDAMELAYFRQGIYLAAEDLLSQTSLSGLSRKEKYLVEKIRKFPIGPISGICIASFSENGDQLSQWRAYSGDHTGYSLGLPSNDIFQEASGSNYLIGKCSYDKNERFDAALDLIKFFISSYDEEWELCHQFWHSASLIAPLFKHPSFCEESKWRVFKKIGPDDPSLLFRPNTMGITCYLLFSLENIAARKLSDFPYPIELRQGPGGVPNTPGHLGLFRKNNWETGVGVSRSASPFRTGR